MIKIVDLSIDIGRIDAVVYSRDKSTIYAILINEFGSICSCIGNMVHGECWHVRELLFELAKRGIDFITIIEEGIKMDMKRRKIKTSIKGINDVWGGIPIGVLAGMYGSHKSGKTTLTASLCCDVMVEYVKQFQMGKIEKPRNVLWFDTESGFAEHFLFAEDDDDVAWLPIFRERYNLKLGLKYYRINMREWEKEKGPYVPLIEIYADDEIEFKGEKVKPDVFFVVIDLDDADRILLSHGRPMAFNYGKDVGDEFKDGAGRVSVLPQPAWKQFHQIWNTPVGKWVEDFDIGMVVYDSLTQPVGVEFVGPLQTKPGRADVNMVILGQAQKLCKEFDLVMMTLHHPSKDPSGFKKGEPTGGKPVGHNHKFFIYLTKKSYKKKKGEREKTARRSRRMCEVTRIPKYRERRDFLFDIMDDGIYDV